ncbi:deoxyribonuclease gamma-like [Aplochiton taeniatus]
MKWLFSPLLPSVLLLLLVRQGLGFRICAFNTPSFNTSKASNYRVIYALTRVVSRCDICLLQGVMDPTSVATKALVKALNRYDKRYHYLFVSSGGLGASPNDLRQYVFLYRQESVTAMGQYQYPDKQNDFTREPFVVRFQSNITVAGEFALIPLHTAPSMAVKEIDQLYEVFEEVMKKWNITNVMFLGNFNAGCAHMTRASKKDIRLFTMPGFYWLIGDKEDTTVRDITNCPYDRIVVHSQSFLKNIEPYSAKVFNFAKALRLSKDKVLKISDRFPVEVELQTKDTAQSSQITPLIFILGLSVIVWPL